MINYLKGWFFLDLIASFPFQILDLVGFGGNSSQFNALRKLARLPRLARLIRVLRILKIVKVLRNNRSIQNFFDKISMNPGTMRLVTSLIAIGVIVHVFSCLWFLQAKMQDFYPDSWVVRTGSMEEESNYQYLKAIYWS